MVIREVRSKDAATIAEIYNYYIESTAITFEEEAVSTDEMEHRISQVLDSGFPWLVVLEDDLVVGYAYANLWNSRSAYRYTVEPSVYLSHEFTGKGFGHALYGELLRHLRTSGYSNVIGVIALPNDTSIRLHERLGFKKAGEFSNIGIKFGEQRSVGYWQLKLSAPVW